MKETEIVSAAIAANDELLLARQQKKTANLQAKIKKVFDIDLELTKPYAKVGGLNFSIEADGHLSVFSVAREMYLPVYSLSTLGAYIKDGTVVPKTKRTPDAWQPSFLVKLFKRDK